MKTVISLVLLSIPLIATAQIEKKIKYHNTRSRWSKGTITMAAFCIKDYNPAQDIKVRGTDDSLMADNEIWVKLNHGQTGFWNITGMKINDSSSVTFFGTWYVLNYDLTPEQQKKRVLSIKGPDNVIRLVRLTPDTSGRLYFKEWHYDEPITIKDSEIISIQVENRNIWVNTEKEKKRLIGRFINARDMTRFVSVLTTVGVLAWLFTVS